MQEPQALLTDDELELLVREGKGNFLDDGMILGEIGAGLMEKGDFDGALDWLTHAVLAIQRSDDKVLEQELDASSVDYLELLSRACLVIRRRILEDLVRRFTEMDPISRPLSRRQRGEPQSRVDPVGQT